MKSYPSIPHWNKGIKGEPVYVFDKLDGSNIRAEWSKKQGWYKFGTRTQLIDITSQPFGEAILIFREKYAEGLETVFKNKYRECKNFVVFLEYYGENSFAGNHVAEDKKDLVLFDVSQYKRGIIPPKEFIENFQHLGIPGWCKDTFNDSLIDIVKSIDDGEGVVCKGVHKNKVWMSKIKTNWWLSKIKEKGHEELVKEYDRLS